MPLKSPETDGDYWEQVLIRAGMILWGNLLAATPNDQGRIVTSMVHDVGKYGGTRDFRLLYADPHIMFPSWNTLSEATEAATKANPMLGADTYRRVACAAAKAQVKRMLADPLFLHRYYHAVLWNRRYLAIHVPFDSGLGQGPGIALAKVQQVKGDAWWWYARNVIVFAYACDRVNMIEGLSYSQMRRSAARLRIWLQNSRFHLRPSSMKPKWNIGSVDSAHEKWIWISDHPLPEWGDEPSVERSMVTQVLTWSYRVYRELQANQTEKEVSDNARGDHQ
jgi:hypothetical protein